MENLSNLGIYDGLVMVFGDDENIINDALRKFNRYYNQHVGIDYRLHTIVCSPFEKTSNAKTTYCKSDTVNVGVLGTYEALEYVRVVKSNLEDERGMVYDVVFFIDANKYLDIPELNSFVHPNERTIYTCCNYFTYLKYPYSTLVSVSSAFWYANSCDANTMSLYYKHQMFEDSKTYFSNYPNVVYGDESFDESLDSVFDDHKLLRYSLYHYFNILGFVNYEIK